MNLLGFIAGWVIGVALVLFIALNSDNLPPPPATLV